MSTNIKRRNFLKNSLFVAGGIVLAPNIISCSSDNEDFAIQIPPNLIENNFNQGVASFDPTNNQVIIWTRYESSAASVQLVWQLATDSNFTEVIREGEVTTDASRDYTIAIEVKDLEAGLKLYYRFVQITNEDVSPIGETLTFAENIAEAKLAVASCANYAYGYFNVYQAIANSDADVVVHLGDYIYEYGPDTYGSFRTPVPAGEIISMDDYRARYRQYRSDDQLKELHRRKPFICVWDDHEITNDAYVDGAENHQDNEGDYGVRKQVALQVYSEYLPNTTNIADNAIIYRNLKIGNLIDLIMLDTRIIGRDKQLAYADYTTAQGINFQAFQTDLLDTSRSMLGQQQKNWLMNQVSGSNANWQIIGQQVLMGKMMMPVELLNLLGLLLSEIGANGSASPETFAAFQNTITSLVAIKLRVAQGDPTVTTEELARVNNVAPYNLDAWDGYYMEREEILTGFENKNVVVLAGDTHNAWYSNLTTNSGVTVGVEVATSSVSSPGLERYLGLDNTAELEQALQVLINDLEYLNASERGYMKLTVNAGEIKTDWYYVDSVTETTFSTQLKNSITI
ncbi:alkaline phosphatase D family protein [Tenacibaculum geojense]|uniref:Alkaline phosphatase D family protein n=1 Tax=Tenacibaculum geojense TaxID=915352 RepID=A0ABW3JQ18_9FLAO